MNATDVARRLRCPLCDCRIGVTDNARAWHVSCPKRQPRAVAPEYVEVA